MIALYPWETVETVNREQIEAEIQTDAEFQQWLDELYALIELGPLYDQPQPAPADPTAGMSELEFMEYTFQ